MINIFYTIFAVIGMLCCGQNVLWGQEMQRVVFFIGLPGSGKGTLGQKLEAQGWKHTSMGGYLRLALERKDKKIMPYAEDIHKGISLPDSIVEHIVENLISEAKKGEKWVIDGYPRTIQQATHLKNYLKKVDWLSQVRFVFFDIGLVRSWERVSDRRICLQCQWTGNVAQKQCPHCKIDLILRKSDKIDIMYTRWNNFVAKTIPMFMSLQKEIPSCCFVLHSDRPVSLVFEDLQAFVRS